MYRLTQLIFYCKIILSRMVQQPNNMIQASLAQVLKIIVRLILLRRSALHIVVHHNIIFISHCN